MSFKITIPPNVEYIINRLEENGHEAYIVGGCVRDSILHREPNDWDITTNAKPEDVIRIFDKTIPTGLKHGTVTVVYNNESYEVTTYRIDGDYSDSRRPDSVEFTDDICMDLARRDFTINAMAYNHKSGLIDPFDGLEDLERKMLYCVGDVEDRFLEDPLRMLRAIRFATELDLIVGSDISNYIEDNGKILKEKVSIERIQREFNKILTCEITPSDSISFAILILKLDFKLFPELEALDHIEQNNPYHMYDAYDHSVMASRNIENRLHLRLASLLHDLGKATTLTTDENGIDHYYGHAVESERMAREILKRFKYDNNTIEVVTTLINYHDVRVDDNPKSVRRFLNKIGSYDLFKDWCSLRWADISAQNPKYMRERHNKLYRIEQIAKEIIDQELPLQISDLNIDGYHLMEIGFKGVEIGIELKRLLAIVIDDPSENTIRRLLESSKSRFSELNKDIN
jgi:tRNA nucleotidyltransferase (CCA-adding enzyme)